MMRFQLFALTIILGSFVIAQEDYLITLQGDTLKGDIEFYQNRFYDEVIIKTDNDKERYKVFQVQRVRMDGNDFKMVTHLNKKVFGQIVSEGALSLFYFRPEGGNQFTVMFFGKNNEYLEVPNINFKNIVADYLSDCPEVANKIRNKELKNGDLETIILNYNNICGKSKTTLPAPQVKVSSSIKRDDNTLIELAELLIDIQAKLDNNEKVPSYMVEALKSYQEKDIKKKLEELLKQLE